MFVADLHTHLIGKICKPTEFGVELEKEYEEIYKFGNWQKANQIYFFCHMGGRFEMSLMFIDQKPEVYNGIVWYCVKEIGVGVSGDWHWYTLNQLMICNEENNQNG